MISLSSFNSNGKYYFKLAVNELNSVTALSYGMLTYNVVRLVDCIFRIAKRQWFENEPQVISFTEIGRAYFGKRFIPHGRNASWLTSVLNALSTTELPVYCKDKAEAVCTVKVIGLNTIASHNFLRIASVYPHKNSLYEILDAHNIKELAQMIDEHLQQPEEVNLWE